jgi:hypothetical protein
MGPLSIAWRRPITALCGRLQLTPSVRPVFAFEKSLEGVGTLTFPVADSPGTVKDAKAVPYYSWANRGRGEMTVWIKTNQQINHEINGKNHNSGRCGG